MHRREFLSLAENIVSGITPHTSVYESLAEIPEKEDIFPLLAGADLIREFHFGREIHLCTICNGKSGKCSEDCSFCSQSVFSTTEAPVYPLMSKSDLKAGGLHAANTPINRYSIVTSGKRLPGNEIIAVSEALSQLDRGEIDTCASLGILDAQDFEALRDAGVTRYHHNLETSESHFPQMCTTHTYQERVETILLARRAGLSVCAGGIFGIGETDGQVLELALALKELDVDSIPLNFLVPIKGTKTQEYEKVSPLRCLKIIAMFRYVLPNKEILVCGGREMSLGELHPLVFYAGASGIMTGDYLTTSGRTLQKDLQMINSLGFTTRKKY